MSVLNLALPPQRHSPDAWLEHQKPFIHTAQNKREEKKERKKEYKNKNIDESSSGRYISITIVKKRRRENKIKGGG